MSPCAPMPMAGQRQVVVAGEDLEATRQRVHQLGESACSLPLASLMAWIFWRPRPDAPPSPDRGWPPCVPARCRRTQAADQRLWPAPGSAGTALPGWACCSRDWRKAPRSARAPRCSSAAWRTSVRVELCVHPAHTGTRPAAASTTMRTVFSHSSSSSVAASPVDPQATRKSMPDSICQFTSAYSAGSSTDTIRPERRDNCRTATCRFHHW